MPSSEYYMQQNFDCFEVAVLPFLFFFILPWGQTSRFHRFIDFPREDGWKPAGLNYYFIFAGGSQLHELEMMAYLGKLSVGVVGAFQPQSYGTEVHSGVVWCPLVRGCESSSSGLGAPLRGCESSSSGLDGVLALLSPRQVSQLGFRVLLLAFNCSSVLPPVFKL